MSTSSIDTTTRTEATLITTSRQLNNNRSNLLSVLDQVTSSSTPSMTSELKVDDSVTPPSSVDMDADFLKELDELDAYMVNISKVFHCLK